MYGVSASSATARRSYGWVVNVFLDRLALPLLRKHRIHHTDWDESESRMGLRCTESVLLTGVAEVDIFFGESMYRQGGAYDDFWL